MSKKNKKTKLNLKELPSGPLNFHTYLSDVEGCGTIRTIIPSLLLNSWRTTYNNARATYSQNYVRDLNYYKNLSFVIFQRAATEANFNIVKDFCNNFKKNSNTGMIYEIDDLLKDIPEWNFASAYYKEYWPFIERSMRMADGMVVSTPKLKEIYQEYNKNIQITPNHLAKFLWGDIPESKPENEKLKIVWAGSENHFNVHGEEGGDFGDELLNYIEKTKSKYEWIFVGGIPNQFRKDNKVTHYPFRHVLEYPRFLKSLNADIALAPLHHCLFNECKSNIKMLEYVACRIPGIYSSIEPYKSAKLKADNDEQFIENIEFLSNNPEKRDEIWKQDYKKVENQLYWEENGNLTDYVNKLIRVFGYKLKIN